MAFRFIFKVTIIILRLNIYQNMQLSYVTNILTPKITETLGAPLSNLVGLWRLGLRRLGFVHIYYCSFENRKLLLVRHKNILPLGAGVP